MTERYEEIRRALVARGYLQGRLARFVLRDLVAAYRPLALARASGKAALLGAPVLGALLAASTVASNRPQLGLRDACILWIYFGVLAAAGLFVLDLAAAGLAGAWARRRGARSSDALRAGLLVSVPVLAYLVAIWAMGRPASGWASDVLFLAAATATTAVVAWLAGLVSLAGIVGRTGEVPDRHRYSAMVAIGILVPVAALFFVIPSTRSADPPAAVPPAPYTPAERSGRLLVVGVDGLDGALVEAASDGGAVDHLLDLLSRGTLYPKHRAPAEPPEVWTTLATGMPAASHGVRQAGSTQLPGVAAPIAIRSGPSVLHAALRFLLPSRTVPTSGAGRRVRTLWEIAGLSRKAAAVGWWASWPARGTAGDPGSGYVVSDRALAKLLAGRSEDRDTAPAALYSRLAESFPADRTRWRREFDERFSGLSDRVSGWAWESFLIDAFAWSTTKTLRDDPELQASFTYLPGLDILRTRLGPGGSESLVVASYLRWLDGAVFAELAGATGDRVVVIADPGRSTSADVEGFVAIAGAGARASCVDRPVGDLDVAPIVLRLAGLPESREMRGSVPARCFEGAPAPPPPIATWGRRGRAEKEDVSDYDPEMVERLKSLGYLR